MAKIPDDMERRLKMVEEASKSLAAYNDLLKSTNELQSNIEHVERQRLKLQAQLLDAQGTIRAFEEGHIKLTKEQVKELNKKVAALEYGLDIEEKTLKVARHELIIRKQAVDEVNKLNVVLNSTLNVTKKLGNQVLKQSGYFLNQQKAVKETELSMGILSNQSNGFRNNVYRASISTNQIGIDTKLLTKIQGTYTDNIGRAVQLNEQELESMAQLAKGTMLGAEGAAEFAAEMEKFNISAEGSVDYIQDVVDLSNKMGLNSGKVIKNLQKNMKLLNKYNFQGGAKGLGKMAALATKFKFEMQDIASFAESIMTPEGAVEVASKLQVLGGEWAKLGDPFELMYRSRNDLKGLTEDVINATKATARFDSATGEVMIDPMEMQRLREVANATGMDFDSLANSAREAAKFTQIQTGMSNIFNQDDKDFLTSMAKFDEKSGEFKVTMQVGDETVTESVKALRQITPAMVDAQRQLKQSLEDRAKQAITFDETLENLKNSFKSVLFPGFEAFATALQSSVGDFHKWAVDSGALDRLADLGKYMGELAGTLIKFAANNPIATGIGLLIGKAAIWYARGVSLGMGFNSVASGGGGAGQIGGKLFKNIGKKGSTLGKMGKLGSVGAIGAGALSAGFSGYDEWTENKEAGMETGENLGRTAMRASGAGLGGWGGAAAGAAIGTAILPVIGTAIGGLIGGALGAWGGGALGDAGGDAAYSGDNNGQSIHQDFISRPGENPISFSSSDTVVGAKEGGPLDKMIGESKEKTAKPGKNVISIESNEALIGVKNMDKISKMFESKTLTNTNDNKVSVEFNKPIKIEGKLEVISGENSKEIDLDNPIFMQKLSNRLMEEITKAVGGGKLSSNPSPA